MGHDTEQMHGEAARLNDYAVRQDTRLENVIRTVITEKGPVERQRRNSEDTIEMECGDVNWTRLYSGGLRY